jgi:sortase A
VLEWGALGIGLVLVAVYAVAMLHRHAGSMIALSTFDDPKDEASAVPNQGSAIDFALWSEKRIKAYRDSLAQIQGEPMAVLEIQRLRIKAPIFSGTGELVLNRGLGWIPGTAKPGSPGNSGVAGHRDGFFRALKDVVAGDAIELHDRQTRSTFRVDNIKIVFPEDVEVLYPRGGQTLTLVTCYPFYFAGDAPQRFIVQAKLEKQAAVSSFRKGGSQQAEAASLILKE